MFKPNTVFVIGAAASFGLQTSQHPSGFPLGAALKSEIAKSLAVEFHDSGFDEKWRATRASRSLYEALLRRHLHSGRTKDDLYSAGRQIMNGVAFSPSIDNFLHSRRENPLIASCIKAAIVRVILQCERCCTQLEWPGKNSTILPQYFDNTWHQIFAEILFAGAERKDIDEALSRVSIISFNYDRCFEQFIKLALSGLYALNRDELNEKSELIKIYHPYGSLGKLESTAFGGSPNSDNEIDPDTCIALSDRIRTFTESSEDETGSLDVRRAINTANRIIFLGFGFGEQNLELLTPSTIDRTSRRDVSGTAKGLSESARGFVQDKLEHRFFGLRQKTLIERPSLQDLTCYAFMDANRHALAE